MTSFWHPLQSIEVTAVAVVRYFVVIGSKLQWTPLNSVEVQGFSTPALLALVLSATTIIGDAFLSL